MHSASLSVALALASGVIAQAVARHLNIPGIVVLLATGVLLGPDVAGAIFPETLAEGLQMLVGFAVAVILFEGGLNLDLRRLRQEQRSIRQLVTVGALVTFVGGTLTARLLLHWDWRPSVLFGALVVVTGPTVVTPLLRRLRIEHSVATVLEAEGILIDAIGAVMAAFALDLVLSPTGETLLSALGGVALRLGLGALIGVVGGYLLAWLLRFRSAIPEGLENVFVLCTALVLFQAANAIVHESGIAAVTVAGIVVGNAKSHVHHELLEFKEQLTVMLIGMLFVLLAADVRVADVQALGWPGVYTVLALMFIVRPLNVVVGTWGSGLSWRKKVLVAWIGPRGIVAAAIGSLFAAKLAQHNLSGGPELRALVFLVIAVTVTFAGLTGGLMSRLLKLRQRVQGWLIFAANPVSIAMAEALRDAKDSQKVVMIDRNPEHCRKARQQGITVVCDNVLDDHALHLAQIETRLGVIGLSENEEINFLLLQKAKREYDTQRRYMAVRSASQTVTEKMIEQADAELAFGSPRDIELWSVRMRRGLVLTAWHRYQAKKRKQEDIPEVHQQDSAPFLPLVLRRGDRVEPITNRTQFRNEDEILLVIWSEQADAAERLLEECGWGIVN